MDLPPVALSSPHQHPSSILLGGSLLWLAPPMMGSLPCDCGPPEELLRFPPPPPDPTGLLFDATPRFDALRQQCERDLSLFGIDLPAGPGQPDGVNLMRDYVLFIVTLAVVIAFGCLLAVLLLLWIQRKSCRDVDGKRFLKQPQGIGRQSNSSSSNDSGRPSPGGAIDLQSAFEDLSRNQEGKTQWSYNSMRPLDQDGNCRHDPAVGAIMYGAEQLPNRILQQHSQQQLCPRTPASSTLPKKRGYPTGIPAAVSVPSHLQLPSDATQPSRLRVNTDHHHYCTARALPLQHRQLNGNSYDSANRNVQTQSRVYEEIPAAVAQLYEDRLQHQRRPPPNNRPPPPPRNTAAPPPLASADSPTTSCCSCSCSPTSLNSADRELEALTRPRRPSCCHSTTTSTPSPGREKRCCCDDDAKTAGLAGMVGGAKGVSSNGRESGYGTEGRSAQAQQWDSPQLKTMTPRPPTLWMNNAGGRAAEPRKGSGASLTVYGQRSESQHSMTYV